jgi:hypothetical protein
MFSLFNNVVVETKKNDGGDDEIIIGWFDPITEKMLVTIDDARIFGNQFRHIDETQPV